MWRNELVAGVERINGLPVRRFPVREERDPHLFGRRSDRVFQQRHSLDDELNWLDAEGLTSPALIDHLRAHANDCDYWLFFSYRCYQAYHGVRAAASRAILLLTAERDSVIALALFQPIFRGARALMYNSCEERAIIQAVSGNHDVPGVVVGVGSDVPQTSQPERFRQKYDIHGPFAIYVGRLEAPRPIERLPGWFAGQREDLPPADEVLAALPAGAALAGASEPPPRLAVSQPPGGA
jgi:hypothetical protein